MRAACFAAADRLAAERRPAALFACFDSAVLLAPAPLSRLSAPAAARARLAGDSVLTLRRVRWGEAVDFEAVRFVAVPVVGFFAAPAFPTVVDFFAAVAFFAVAVFFAEDAFFAGELFFADVAFFSAADFAAVFFAVDAPSFFALALPAGGGFNATPARRAFDNPIATACFADRTPCLPSRTWSISSFTNAPACVPGALPSRFASRARSMVFLSGITVLLVRDRRALCEQCPYPLRDDAAHARRTASA